MPRPLTSAQNANGRQVGKVGFLEVLHGAGMPAQMPRRQHGCTRGGDGGAVVKAVATFQHG